ncbi:MAG TPA: gluconate 2-dehydrogenase subunit 3 family protein [Steroidobacteraceae bacterium]|nr:gluconate 2-dehydrogenase subunit 3 family protein [Steroidobacteraceae bacterium]
MSNDVRDEPLTEGPDSGNGPLRHFRVGRRAVLTSLATGVGAAVFASRASAAHVHGAAQAATPAVPATTATADSALLFFDRHAFDTLAALSEQIVPGSRAVQVPEFLDRLLAVESFDTQTRFTQALGAFEREAREAHDKPWKALTAEQATALLTKISTQPDGDAARQAFDNIKGAVAETFYSTEVGMKELGWNGGIAFAPPAVCG